MNDWIREETQRRGIRRLCHFTPTRNLVHILTDSVGIDARQQLASDEIRVFTPTDPARFDGHTEYISCSIEYPNLWYLQRAKERDPLFTDWAVLFLAPHHMWASSTKFCPHNAALRSGAHVSSGDDAFRTLFADTVIGAMGLARARSSTHLPCSPTDDQAEVLVHGRVPLHDLLGIAVPSDDAAANHWARLELLGLLATAPPLIVSPEMFDAYGLRGRIVAGQRPEEHLWTPTS